jgi:hemoglobin-like flavoprotein
MGAGLSTSLSGLLAQENGRSKALTIGGLLLFTGYVVKRQLTASASASDGPITAREVQIVQDSWKAVKKVGGESGHAVIKDIFYQHLLKDPNVKQLFRNSDMKLQATKLWQTLHVAVDGLSNLGPLVPVLQDLGKAHVKYGVQVKHFDAVGASLLYTLATGLGPAFTPELKVAWTKVYGVVATTMIAAGKEARMK